jgi:hypothetical protein
MHGDVPAQAESKPVDTVFLRVVCDPGEASVIVRAAVVDDDAAAVSDTEEVECDVPDVSFAAFLKYFVRLWVCCIVVNIRF